MEIAAATSTADAIAEAHRADVAAPAFGRRNLITAVALYLVALGGMVLLDHALNQSVRSVSNGPDFIYQAEAFLHGRWNIVAPPRVPDVVLLDGKQYIVYPPFPALLMVPLVAIWGLKTSDVLFTLVISAANLPLLYLLLEQLRANGLTRRSWVEHAIISVCLFFGSISLVLSLHGGMWFTAQIVCMACTLLSLLLAFRHQFAWSAVLLGCAFFSRGTLALGFPVLFYLAWQDAGKEHLLERFVGSLARRKPDWAAVPWRRLTPIALIAAVTVALFAVRNVINFGSPFESGYDILVQQHYPAVRDGVFNVKYIPANIVANFFTFPHVAFQGPFDRHPVIDMLDGNGVGISVFFTTPLFLLLFWRNRRLSWLRVALWATVGLFVVAVLLFHAAGWYQFGARYLFDGYPYAFLLLALNETRIDWRFVALGLLGIGINLLGAHQFWTYHIIHI